MSKSESRRRPAALVLVGVISMIAALFVLSGSATAHSATITGEVFCSDDGELKVVWQATSFSPEGPLGLHPDITVDWRTNDLDWDIAARGAFTDENGRQLLGAHVLPDTTTFVEVRVTPAPGVPWSGGGDTGGGDSVMISVPPGLLPCDAVDLPTPSPTPDDGDEGDTGEDRTPTPVPTEEPTETPTEEPTETPTEEPTEEPTETPTEEPTETPTEEPTETPTEEPTQTPTETPTETPDVRGPEPESPAGEEDEEEPEVLGRVVAREELAETGVESMMLTVVGVALLAGGAMVSVTGLSLARRRS